MKKDVERDLEHYLKSIRDLYNESLISVKKQEQLINDLNKQIEIYYEERPKQLDRSLEDFRILFNDTHMEKLSKMPTSQQSWKENLQKSKTHIFHSSTKGNTTDTLKYKVDVTLKELHKPHWKAEDIIKGIGKDFERIQEDFKDSARKMEEVKAKVNESIILYRRKKYIISNFYKSSSVFRVGKHQLMII